MRHDLDMLANRLLKLGIRINGGGCRDAYMRSMELLEIAVSALEQKDKKLKQYEMDDQLVKDYLEAMQA